MDLMDKPKADFNSQYISIKDFLFYIAFTRKETVSDVASWLLYNSFSEDINSYEIDRHYRSWIGKKKYGIDKNIERFFEQITLDGYHAYHAYEHYLIDKKDGLDVTHWEDSFIGENRYKLVHDDFYLKIKKLYKLDYIKKLNIDLAKASEYMYSIYRCDNIDARLKNNNILHYSGMGWSSGTLKEKVKAEKEITSEQKEENDKQLEIAMDNLRKVIEWATSDESMQEIDEKLPKDIADDIKEIITDKEKYERLTPIQKYTFYMKNIVLPLAQKIWFFDKETNLLMRKQVARLVVELLPKFDLTENQVDDWLKQSDLVPQAIIDRCAQHDYGNTKPEKIQREVVEDKIRSKVSPEIQSLIENAPKF